jgi:glycine/D-amino acid oxidase-like deaminating enzyme
MAIPTRSPHMIIGAGIHGLSTAYHLALQLKATDKGDRRDIIIVDKSGICSGATGIACGVIRNNYFQPAMCEQPRTRRGSLYGGFDSSTGVTKTPI